MTMTYEAARRAALDGLRAQGWTVRGELKTPHATTPDGELRLWFKARSVYLSIGAPHRFGFARSMHVDLRELRPEALAAKAQSVAAYRSAPSVVPPAPPVPDAADGEVDDDCACWLCQRRRGCFVAADSDAPVPDGWCEVQRDDSPDHEHAHFFDSDTAAAAWVSRAARAVSVETGETIALHVDEDGEAVVPAWWCVGHSVRLIVPELDAIDRGLLGAPEDR